MHVHDDVQGYEPAAIQDFQLVNGGAPIRFHRPVACDGHVRYRQRAAFDVVVVPILRGAKCAGVRGMLCPYHFAPNARMRAAHSSAVW